MMFTYWGGLAVIHRGNILTTHLCVLLHNQLPPVSPALRLLPSLLPSLLSPSIPSLTLSLARSPSQFSSSPSLPPLSRSLSPSTLSFSPLPLSPRLFQDVAAVV